MSVDEDVALLSRRPEAGGLEERKPGIARAVVEVMYARLPFFRWPHARAMTDGEALEIFTEITLVQRDLASLINRFELTAADAERFIIVEGLLDDLLSSAQRNFNFFAPMSDKINLFAGLVQHSQAVLFELCVSTLFEAERIWFHEKLVTFYQGPRFTPYGKLIPYKVDPEIDLVIRRKDGRDLWVEVKNNAITWTPADFAEWAGVTVDQLPQNLLDFQRDQERSRAFGMSQALLEQSRYQLQTQSELKSQVTADLLVVTRAPLPDELHAALRTMGVATWPLYPAPQSILPNYFESVRQQIDW